MTKLHTKGPWMISGSAIREDFGPLKPGRAIAVVVGDYGSGSWPYSVEDPAEKRANANLIVAAPELLQALKTLVKEAEQCAFEAWLCQESPSGDSGKVKSSWRKSSTFADFIAQYKTAIAAVAKATGEVK